MLIVDLNRCNGCDACVQNCPQGTPALVDGTVHFESSLCIGCQTCADICPTGAILAMPAANIEEAATAIPWTIPIIHAEEAGKMAEVEVVLPRYRRW